MGTARWTLPSRAARLLAASLVAALVGCGGDASSPPAPPPPTPTTITDTSGDFAITLRADSATELTVSWEDPTAGYLLDPYYRYSIVYRDGATRIASTSAFGFTDTGLQPDTTYCYRVEVIAWYQMLWSVYPYGWSSGTACLGTRYGLRVLASAPAAGEVSVPVDSAISVSFNAAIDPASVTPATFRVSDATGEVAGGITVTGNSISFKPLAGLALGRTYSVTVGVGVHDLAGYALQAPYSWTFTERLSVACLNGVWGSSGADVFVVAGDGAVLHYDGSAWTSNRGADGRALGSVWGSAANNVYAAGGGRILRYDGSGWSEVWQAGTAPDSPAALWGSSADDVFAVGTGGLILHFDGRNWTAMNSGTGAALIAVWGAAANDVFAAGIGGTILHYDGSRWAPMSSGVGTDLFALWGFSGGDVLAGGRNYDEPNLLYYNGSTWSADPLRQNDITALWGFAGGPVYAASLYDVRMRVPYSGYPSGYAWPSIYSGSASLNALWGTSAGDLYAAGCGGTVMHYDGAGWRQVLL